MNTTNFKKHSIALWVLGFSRNVPEPCGPAGSEVWLYHTREFSRFWPGAFNATSDATQG